MLVRGVRLGVRVAGSSSSVSALGEVVSELDVSELDVSELDVSELDGGVIDGLMSVVDSDAGGEYDVDVLGVVVGTSDRAVAVVVATVGGAMVVEVGTVLH
jgi:hypothetical protein